MEFCLLGNHYLLSVAWREVPSSRAMLICYTDDGLKRIRLHRLGSQVVEPGWFLWWRAGPVWLCTARVKERDMDREGC